jgi:hypothetical protein
METQALRGEVSAEVSAAASDKPAPELSDLHAPPHGSGPGIGRYLAAQFIHESIKLAVPEPTVHSGWAGGGVHITNVGMEDTKYWLL